jgi:hypothetical protein
LPPELVDQIKATDAALESFAEAYSAASQKSTEYLAIEKQLVSEEKKLNDIRKKQGTKNTLLEGSEATLEAAKAEKVAIEEKIKVLQKYQATVAAYDKAKAAGEKASKSTTLNFEG